MSENKNKNKNIDNPGKRANERVEEIKRRRQRDEFVKEAFETYKLPYEFSIIVNPDWDDDDIWSMVKAFKYVFDNFMAFYRLEMREEIKRQVSEEMHIDLETGTMLRPVKPSIDPAYDTARNRIPSGIRKIFIRS